MRVHHWIKNIIVFMPLFFNGNLFSFNFVRCLLGFLSFCCISSCVYIINDIRDADKDRLHSVKCTRPIASGKISKKNAAVLAVILALISVGLVCTNLKALCIIAVYLAVNIAYSFGLKNVPIADIVILASGYVLRLIAGSFVTGIVVSDWLYLTIIAGSFYLGFGKRRGELTNEGDGKRKVLEHYTYGFLDKSMNMCMTLALVFYSLWSISGEKNFLWTVAAVLIIVLRYNYNIEKQSHGDPIEVILKDRVLLVLFAVYGIIMGICVYVL